MLHTVTTVHKKDYPEQEGCITVYSIILYTSKFIHYIWENVKKKNIS